MRRRRTNAALAQLDAQIIAVLLEDHPQTVRHVFYRMTDPRLPEPVEKTEHGYRQVVARLVALRRAGDVPYEWIADSTRSGVHVSTWANPGEVVQNAAESYRTNPWDAAGVYVEVWCESRSIAGVLAGDCNGRAVSLYPAGGFTSLTLPYEAARRITGMVGMDVPIRVLYVGDYDPAGLLIPDSIESELHGHLPGRSISFDRLAITEAQIGTHGLPTKPRKAGELRLPDVATTVEAEAMPAGLLRGLLRDAIDEYLPVGALEDCEASDEREREALRALASHVARDGAAGVLAVLRERPS